MAKYAPTPCTARARKISPPYYLTRQFIPWKAKINTYSVEHPIALSGSTTTSQKTNDKYESARSYQYYR